MKTLAFLSFVSLSFASDLTVLDERVVGNEPSSIIDHYAGLGAARDSEQNMFSMAILRRAKERGQTVSIETWKWKGKDQIHVMVLIADGIWSGPNPPMGYYTTSHTRQVINFSK